MTPYYQDATTTLYHGRWQDVLAQVALPRVDLVLTDPPYGVRWQTDYATGVQWKPSRSVPKSRYHDWPALAGDTAPFDPSPWLAYPQVILWGANCYSDRLPMGRWLIWDKRYKSGKSFKPSHGEAAWMKGGHGVRIYQQTWQGVARSALHASEWPVRSLHPTQKPVALMQWCLDLAQGRTHRVQTVLDPYCGSGSVLIAAKARGLQAIGIELEEAYCATTARRLERTAVEEAA
jgi:site-specific DNA-methyltransferase (adenine-specific)